MHEEEDHEERLADRDDEREWQRPRPEVHAPRDVRRGGQQDQRGPHPDVGQRGVVVAVLGQGGSLLDQVQKREEENPDQVHEVPVESGELDAQVVMRAVVPVDRAVEDDAQHRHPDEHVQPVQPGHEEIERPVHRGARKLDRLESIKPTACYQLIRGGCFIGLDYETVGSRDIHRSGSARHSGRGATRLLCLALAMLIHFDWFFGRGSPPA